MKILRLVIIAVALAAPDTLHAAAVCETCQLPPTVRPGQSVTVSGKFEQGKPLTVKLYPQGSTTGVDAKSASVAQGQATFSLPDKLPLGRYSVELTYDGSPTPERIPGELNPVTLDSAYPTTAYRNARGTFDFAVIGQNFNTDDPEANKVIISGRGPIITKWCKNKQECETSTDIPRLWVESAEKLHVYGYDAGPYQGPLSFSVKVGDTPSAEKKLTLSRMSETGVLLWSLGVFLVLAYLIYRLVARGMRDNVIHGRRYSPFWAFFIDKQTDSYSLSKFQFLSFSSVFVFGYLYVFLCRWLVQWQFTLPDVPSSFTGILAISAGTTLAAAGATAARGSKGSGPMMPTAADFICSGGQVIPERFQFFVWTLVACIGFLALLVSQDPATIDGFPSFPQGLLYVMGVSAGGYLGGKLARPAGPVIRNIALSEGNAGSPPGGRTVITIQGENLSKEADFFIDRKLLPIVPDAREKLLTGTPQDQASDRSFCSELKIAIDPAAGIDLSTGDHDFRIMNKDGQFADTQFTADPPAITGILEQLPLTSPPSSPEPNKIIAKASETTITVTGSGFREGTLVRWKPATAQDPIELTPAAVKFVDSRELEITLVPGEIKGTGTLVLVTPNGFSAVATVAVV
jgi:hypothetical protein